MELNNLNELLKNNSYPGRGIVVGKTADGENMVVAYFIMGRSENSRNRVFIEDGLGIKTKAHDEAKLTDPSLIIYSPVRVYNNKTIVTNGDQTDTIYNFLNDGKTFEDALRTRTFEPDAPNFTPRISAIIDGDSYKISILKSAYGDETGAQKYFFEYHGTQKGEGHFIHTYKHDGNPIPSFEGEPKRVGIVGSLEQFANNIWQSLDADNKVSLFTRFINIKTGQTQTKIINKNV